MKPTLPLFAVLALFTLCACHERKNTDTALIIPSAPQEQTQASAVLEQNSNGDAIFQATGHGTASKYERLVDAQQRADSDALAAAINKSGVDIFSGYSDMLSQSGKTDTQAISRYLLSMSAAAVSWERSAAPVCGMGPDGSTKCTVSIRGDIRQKGRRDPSFSIMLSDDFRPLYRNGESVSFGVKLSQKAYLYIFSVDEDQNAYLLFPNARMKDNLLEAGQIVSFPDQLHGIKVNAALLPGKDGASEILHLVASKQPLLTLEETQEKTAGDFKLLSAGTMPSLMEKLGALDRAEWAMKVLPYQIVR